MRLQFKVFGFEVASWELTHHQADAVAEAVEAVERHGSRLLDKGISKMSTWWVARAMSQR